MFEPNSQGMIAGRIAIYARVSSDEQARVGSIQNQIDFARRYCELHGLEIAEVYEDEGVSGTVSPEKRPAGGKMLADAKEARFNTLLVYRLDRLSRRLWDLLNTYEALNGYGVSLRSMTEPLDTSSPVGRFVFQLLGSMAELERETIRERTELGMERALFNGKAPGRMPYGYKRDEAGRLIHDATEAAIVRQMFALATSGTPAGTIARMLNDREVPPPWAGRGYKYGTPTQAIWRHTAVLAILHNPVYWSGQWRYERKGGAIFTVPAPPLVEHAAALMVEQALSRNNIAAKRPHRVYLLSGMIRCGECGASWVGSGGSRNVYYVCGGAKHSLRYNRPCTMRPVRADLLDAQIWADIKTVGDHPERLAEKVAAKLSESAGDVEAARRELAAIEEEYKALTTERLEAQLRSDRGHMSREELNAYLRAGVGRVHELERLRVELAERLALRQVSEARMATVEEVCRRLRDLIAEAEHDPKLKQELVRGLVQEVTMRRHEDGRTVPWVEYLIAAPAELGGDSSTPASAPPIPICPRAR